MPARSTARVNSQFGCGNRTRVGEEKGAKSKLGAAPSALRVLGGLERCSGKVSKSPAKPSLNLGSGLSSGC